MSRRTRRVLFATPFYMLFEFFLIKYIFLLFGGLNDIYLFVLTVLVGLLHCIPMFFETKKSTFFGRLLTTINGIWMWASVMFLIDIIVIYLIGRFITLPFEVVFGLILVVPILGIYNYYKAHKLIVSEKTLNLDNLTRDIDIAHLSDVHFGSVRHKSIIAMIANKLKELEDSCELTIISGDLADGSSVVEEDDLMAFKEVNMPIIFTPGNHDFYPGIDNVIKACENAGIIVLDNQRKEFGDLSVFGLTFSFEDREVPKVDESWINLDMINIINYDVFFI